MNDSDNSKVAPDLKGSENGKRFNIVVLIKPNNPLEVVDEEGVKVIFTPLYEDSCDTYQILSVSEIREKNEKKSCPDCSGNGEIDMGPESDPMPCPSCMGSGEDPAEEVTEDDNVQICELQSEHPESYSEYECKGCEANCHTSTPTSTVCKNTGEKVTWIISFHRGPGTAPPTVTSKEETPALEPEPAQTSSMALSILKCVFDMGGNYGRTTIARVLTGSVSKKILTINVSKLETYGVAKKSSMKEVISLMDWLIQENYLAYVEDSEFPVLVVTSKGLDVLDSGGRV